MPQEPTDILADQLFLDIEVDQTVFFMTQAAIVETPIKREERRPIQLMKQRDYLVVFHPLPPNVLANLPEGDAPAPQQASLTLGDVLIQDVHAGRDSWAYSTA